VSSDQPPQGRVVTLVLVTADGALVGALPPFEVESPWWQDVEPVVREARVLLGVEVTVLRLLAAQGRFPGGSVAYLAETSAGVTAEPWPGTLDEHPLRLPWARPGGPQADVAWAQRALAHHGLTPIAPPEQVRTWNLSSMWRFPIEAETVWFKTVPPFFAHEGALLELLQAQPSVSVPRLLAHEGRRMLLHEIPGEDLYEPTITTLRLMVGQLVRLQVQWIERIGELTRIGLHDWRADPLASAIRDVVDRVRPELSEEERLTLAAFTHRLGDRFAAIEGCGLPDTLVHGDFHPGNHRGDPDAPVLLDWGDGGVGHPLLDQPAFLGRVRPEWVEEITGHWNREWQAAIPGSDPKRASALIASVAAARQAVIYQKFLDNIEPSERVYHAADPAEWLRRTAEILERERDFSSGAG
jgi:Ser/Thr protein kinase RdoA (MazF antagonist)